jgi:hypothetical protein
MLVATCYLVALAGGAVLPKESLRDNGAGQTHSPLKASPAFFFVLTLVRSQYPQIQYSFRQNTVFTLW